MVIHSFLNAEFNSNKNPWKKQHIIKVLSNTSKVNDLCLSNPNFSSIEENTARYRALMSIRRDTWFNLPPDTIWKRVTNFNINNENVVLLAPKTEKELSIYNNRENVDINGIILYYQNNIYYVIEGNHRLSQYKLNSMIYNPEFLYVGVSLSGMNCPLINSVNYYAEKNVINHWSELYDGDINPDK